MRDFREPDDGSSKMAKGKWSGFYTKWWLEERQYHPGSEPMMIALTVVRKALTKTMSITIVASCQSWMLTSIVRSGWLRLLGSSGSVTDVRASQLACGTGVSSATPSPMVWRSLKRRTASTGLSGNVMASATQMGQDSSRELYQAAKFRKLLTLPSVWGQVQCAWSGALRS